MAHRSRRRYFCCDAFHQLHPPLRLTILESASMEATRERVNRACNCHPRCYANRGMMTSVDIRESGSHSLFPRAPLAGRARFGSWGLFVLSAFSRANNHSIVTPRPLEFCTTLSKQSGAPISNRNKYAELLVASLGNWAVGKFIRN